MKEDIDDLMTELAAAMTAGRTKTDRYAEFRTLFLGSDQGKRVLHDILAWGRIYGNPVRTDTHQTYLCLGERNLAIKIISTIMVEPQERPTRQRSKPQPTGD